MTTLSLFSEPIPITCTQRLGRKKKSNDDMTYIYTDIYQFLTSQEHCTACSLLSESPQAQKLSSKICMMIVQQELKKEANLILDIEEKKLNDVPELSFSEHSSASLSKICHVGSACLHKILSRLRSVVTRNMGKMKSENKLERDCNYKLHRLLKGLRVSEDCALETTSIPESMYEIEYKQGSTRGLLHVSDTVFMFFANAHMFLQKLLSTKAFHFYDDKIHLVCRQKISTNNRLMQDRSRLFAKATTDDDDDQTFACMVDELYGLVVEHFLRISIIEGLHAFKNQIPKTKKQALRSKVIALGEREYKKKRSCTHIDDEGFMFALFVILSAQILQQ